MTDIQIEDGTEPLTISAVWIDPTPSASDPLGQHGYLALKITGGVYAVIYDTDTIPSTIDHMVKRIGEGVREALTVAVTRAGKA